MAGVRGMDVIPDPVKRWRALSGLVERSLEMHERRAVLRRQLGNDSLVLDGLRVRRAVLWSSGEMVHDEGLAKHQLQLGVRSLGFVDDLFIGLLILIECHAMTFVIHANENAQHIRLQIQCVLLPALLQIEHCVAAHAAIEELQLCLWEGRAELRGDDERIAMAEDMIRVCGATAIAIGNRVALEQDARAGSESSDGLRSRNRVGCEQQGGEEKGCRIHGHG